MSRLDRFFHAVAVAALHALKRRLEGLARAPGAPFDPELSAFLDSVDEALRALGEGERRI